MKYQFTNPYFNEAVMSIKNSKVIITLINDKDVVAEDCDNLYSLINAVIKHYNLFCSTNYIASRQISNNHNNGFITLTNLSNKENKQVVYYNFSEITKTDLDGVFLDLQTLMVKQQPEFIEKFNNQ